jgi:hypothetical protein
MHDRLINALTFLFLFKLIDIQRLFLIKILQFYKAQNLFCNKRSVLSCAGDGRPVIHYVPRRSGLEAVGRIGHHVCTVHCTATIMFKRLTAKKKHALFRHILHILHMMIYCQWKIRSRGRCMLNQ